jgi:hypothetical protein
MKEKYVFELENFAKRYKNEKKKNKFGETLF